MYWNIFVWVCSTYRFSLYGIEQKNGPRPIGYNRARPKKGLRDLQCDNKKGAIHGSRSRRLLMAATPAQFKQDEPMHAQCIIL